MSAPMVPALRKLPPAHALSSAPAGPSAPGAAAPPSRRRRVLAGAAALGAAWSAGLSAPLRAQSAPPVPPGYPQSYAEIIARALREGAVNVHASTDADIAQPLVSAFEARYPGIRVRYRELNTVELNDGFLAEGARLAAGEPPGAETADVLWSTAMDLQIKLVNDGHALRYASPERAGLPAWAAWRDEAWGTTFEPAVIVYNRRHFAGMQTPRSRTGLARLLQENTPRWRQRVVTYDVEKSGVGYLLAQQDARMGDEFWYLAQALGRCGVQLSASTANMIERIASGEFVMGYNLLGSYALSLMERGAEIDVIAPRDYTLVMSRVAFIARRAAHPNAARLWLDFLLSRAGQTVLGQSASQLYTIRTDTDSVHTAAALAERLGYALKPISVGPGLLAAQDTLRKRAFFARWRDATRG